MKINANFDVIALAHSADMPWEASPMPGVARRMLDRVGGEVARATSLVKYDPGSAFSSHVHSGGEEFLVLEGTFQDEHGEYPAGTYVRNPINTEHTPSSDIGCEMFVKLWQFDSSETDIVRIDTNSLELQATQNNDQITSATLFENFAETVAIENWAPQAEVQLQHEGGLEILIIDGSILINDERLTRHAWLRLPQGALDTAVAESDGARIWIKRGHLRHINVPS